ncbi:4097_t:CDS:2, partial [Funneliformis geosporum]
MATKTYDRLILGVEIVRELEETLSRHHEDTIGVLVTPSNENYTKQARRAAKTSEFNIILTDKENICSDLIDFVELRQKKVQNSQPLLVVIIVFGQFRK